ncbi:MAG TPA: serine/threonine-protein kinase, partial [Polyangiaceae bacterium]|nr:serine/threonine-protein kinase [Polyangiaceae bacterium]
MGLAPETGARQVEPSEPWSEGLIDERYQVIKRLGGGGMGDVYEVEHVRLKRLFALKLLRAELAGERELGLRFEREARDIAALHSDHVVSIVDSGTLSDGRPYFVMERLIGQDLKQLLAGTTELPVARAVNLGIDICLGLHAAHSAGLVHRDVKPEN